MIGRLIEREVRRGFSGPAWLPAAFFLLVATLVPFAVGPDARLLARIGGGALWIAALTAALLPVERLVEPDRADGVLDQLCVRGVASRSGVISALPPCGRPASPLKRARSGSTALSWPSMRAWPSLPL